MKKKREDKKGAKDRVTSHIVLGERDRQRDTERERKMFVFCYGYIMRILNKPQKNTNKEETKKKIHMPMKMLFW